MAMKDYEPKSGYNMPPGCDDPPETLDGHTCGECRRWKQYAETDCGVCVPELMQAVAHMSAEQAAMEALDEGHMYPAGDRACDDFKEVD